MNMIVPDELKNKVIEWCKEDSVTVKEKEIAEDDSVLHWNLTISNTVVYCQKKYPDRIFYQNEINFSPEQIKMMNSWPKGKMNSLIGNLSRNAIEFDYNQDFLFDDKKIKGIRIHKFTIGDISKSEFLQTLIRVQNVINYTHNLLGSTMGVEMNIKKQQEQAKEDNPLSG